MTAAMTIRFMATSLEMRWWLSSESLPMSMSAPARVAAPHGKCSRVELFGRGEGVEKAVAVNVVFTSRAEVRGVVENGRLHVGRRGVGCNAPDQRRDADRM